MCMHFADANTNCELAIQYMYIKKKETKNKNCKFCSILLGKAIIFQFCNMRKSFKCFCESLGRAEDILKKLP